MNSTRIQVAVETPGYCLVVMLSVSNASLCEVKCV